MLFLLLKKAIETMDLKLIQQFFPTELISSFDVVGIETLCNVETKSEYLIIDFIEKNILPFGLSVVDYECKDFTEGKLIQDFPLRGKAVFLNIKKRRWRHKDTKQIVKSDFSFIAEGSKFTQELSDFLKDTGGYATRYHEQHSKLLSSE